ncbi:uncharacterized WD repeat-containing protein C3H5.08c-like [Euphorbia lathyris]|uniref:uncharacterized WD repeat-containing protein C3H5.08c-like n=1 Tax=Euphorbia lathyris TaxID=212925 RepID=UPI003313E897
MMNSYMLDGDLFFDCVECFESEFEIWLSEPQSVEERQESFLSQMGLADQLPCKSDQITGLDKISDCDEIESHVEEGNLACYDAELEERPIVDSQSEASKTLNEGKHIIKSWCKFFLPKRKHDPSVVSKSELGAMKVKQKKKMCKEFTGVYMRQELKAHRGAISSVKFSPDGEYLATGGEDGVVRIWHVTSVDAPHESFPLEGNLKEGKLSFWRKKNRRASVMIPEKIFQIEESPIHEFRGHGSDILDLAWSNSNCLLSASKDKTVRLWQVGYTHCIHVFQHKDYVTSIQFNPIDENYFISGSIDGKVRIWGVTEKRVVDWVDARDVTTVVCYQPDGMGFVVGSIIGTCRFYKASGNEMELEAEICVGRKKSLGKGITGIQFSSDIPGRVMITSKDSRLRIFDGFDVVQKFKGLTNSGSQRPACFTSTGRHIASVGEDSRVYLWDYDPSSKHGKKSVRSCEHFFFEGISAAIPWSGRMQMEDSSCASPRRLGNCFSFRGRSSATSPKHASLPDSWGLVIVTAGFDGTTRTFHNYGLPLAGK